MIRKIRDWLWFRRHKKKANAAKDKIKAQNGHMTLGDMADLLYYDKECSDAFCKPMEDFLNSPSILSKRLRAGELDG